MMNAKAQHDHDPAPEDEHDDAAGSDDAPMTAADAQTALYAFFHREKPAYTHKGHVYHRYYCLACLHNEIAAVRAAREQFGMAQGREAPIEVLTGIGKSNEAIKCACRAERQDQLPAESHSSCLGWISCSSTSA
jgi:hypothetical protein